MRYIRFLENRKANSSQVEDVCDRAFKAGFQSAEDYKAVFDALIDFKVALSNLFLLILS